MKNTTNSALTKVLIIALMILQTSCASSQTQLSKPLERRTLRIDPVTLDRFIYCGRVRKNVFSSWKQVCDYIPFADKAQIKVLVDKNMVLKVRVMP